MNIRLPVSSGSGNYEIAMATYGDASVGRSLLCLPGILETSAVFGDMTRSRQSLASICAIDFSGRGESDFLSSPAAYRMSTCLTESSVAYSYLMGALSHRRGEAETRAQVDLFGADRRQHIHLIGNSMGGLIAMFLARQKPAWLRSIVLNDIGSMLPWASLISLFGALGRSFMSAGESPMVGSSGRLARQLDVDEKLIAAVIRPGYLNLPHQRTLAGLCFDDCFGAITTPVLIVHSIDSPVMPASLVHKMRDLPSNYSFHSVPGNQHPVPYTTELIDKIARFQRDAEDACLRPEQPLGLAECSP